MQQVTPVEIHVHVMLMSVTSKIDKSWLTEINLRNIKIIDLFTILSIGFLFTLKYQIGHKQRWCELWCGQKDTCERYIAVGHTLAVGP